MTTRLAPSNDACGLVLVVGDAVQDQIVLAREIREQSAFGDLRRCGDLDDGHPVVTAFQEQPDRGLGDGPVVGAGPTGLMLAGELALAGVTIEVIERQTGPSGQSRGGGINPRTSDVLAMRGMLEAVTERAIPRAPAGGAHFAGLPVSLDARPWRTRYPDGVVIAQDRLEDVLEDHLHGMGVAVRRGTTLTDFTCDEAGVESTVSGPEGDRAVRSRYLVACDGAHSTVRKLTGKASDHTDLYRVVFGDPDPLVGARMVDLSLAD